MTTSSAILRRLSVMVAMLALVAAAGCAKKQKPDEGAVPTGVTQDADTNAATGDSDSGKAMGMKTVNFPYDAFTLDATAKTTLKDNADILKANPNLKIQIEGHCDTRGGIQYNIALAEKRANAAKSFLTEQGVAGDRVTTISFGKERPLDQGTSEEAHAKNRRANFVITSR